jgi:predicted nuclease of restriction endonuclease-like (RecB) superfamily
MLPSVRELSVASGGDRGYGRFVHQNEMPMAKRTPNSTSPARPASRTSSYAVLLGDIKSRIQQAQTRAMLAVNSELVRLYWDIGRLLESRQREEGYGTAVIPRLAKDLHNQLPEVKGFSERNLGLMIAFARAYPEPTELLQQPVAKPEDSLLWSIPWGHHAVLLAKFKDLKTRVWYMQQTLKFGWSRSLLVIQVQASAHLRQGQAVTNFATQLPSPQSDLAQQALKDPYLFDFLTLAEPFRERELETGLVSHLEKFLLELGQGFAFVGRQYRLTIGDTDFYVDLLFYHLHLRAFFVIDLKTGAFKPEYAGKLNFYCNVVNDLLRHPGDAPTIGLILCQTKDNLLAEYSFARIDQPIGVSTYELTKALPQNLTSALPTIEQIEAELAEVESVKPKKDKPKPKQPKRS